MNTWAIASFLKENVGPFRDVSPERLRRPVEGSRVRLFEASEMVMHQGDEAAHFGIVSSGTISVSTGAAQRSLGQLKSGETFNALAQATGDLVIADFIAASRCELRSGILLPGNLKQRNNGS